MNKIILHLCASEFASDTRDYTAAGYDVRPITKEIDVRMFEPTQIVSRNQKFLKMTSDERSIASPYFTKAFFLANQ